MTTLTSRIVSVPLFVLIALCGCYETEQDLGPRDQSRVDRRFVGEWEFRNPQEGATVLTVFNFDDRQYYLEWAKVGESPQRGAAFVAEVGGAAFAHVRDLKPDGVVAAKHTLLRLDLAGDGRLSLRFLNDQFFEGKDVSTSPKLRALVAQNVDNTAMYDSKPLYGWRVAK